MKAKEMTAKEAAKSDPHFLFCCEKAGIPPTERQLRKFRNGSGKAYEVHRKIAQGNKK